MNDILDKIDQICRVCLSEQSLMFSLIHKSYSHVYQMLMSTTTIKVELNDNLPQLVCSACLTRLENAYLFKQECEQSDQTLRKLILENKHDFDTKLGLGVFLVNNRVASEENALHASSVVKVELHDEEKVAEIKEEIEETEGSESSESEDENEDESEESNSSDSDTLYEIKKKLTKKTNIKKPKHKKSKSKSINNNEDIVENSINKLKIKRLKQRHEYYECRTCQKTFKHHKRFWHHKNTSCPFFSCYVCFKQFLTIDEMKNHCEQTHLNQKYICNQEDCDKEFNNYFTFLSHKKNDHNFINYIKCFECNMEFESHEYWDMHIQKHMVNPYKCEKCDESFPTRKKLCNHVKIHPDYFKCNICSRNLSSNRNLSRHMKTHTASFVCDECGQCFKANYLLKNHVNVVHKGLPRPNTAEEKKHLCPYCGNRFRLAKQLTVHIRLHTGQKPFACDKCDYKIHSKGLLKSHLRSHTGERPFHCEYCGKLFATRSYLTVHIRFHTGYRPYKCSHAPCEKGFTNSKDLKVHERTHTGIKLYHCEICNNSFTTLHYFKVHTKKHQNQ